MFSGKVFRASSLCNFPETLHLWTEGLKVKSQVVRSQSWIQTMPEQSSHSTAESPDPACAVLRKYTSHALARLFRI